ncbi:TerC family protein [Magnetovibrio sp.]|uniref:TerC family protein n=1 Tax=Magnetovibrio sp. TaxID=2024836 RepID=UPI002F956C51
MDLLLNPEAWISLLTLVALEAVLGIDNLVFIAILTDRVDAAKRDLARRLGIGMALITRLMLLFTLAWIAGLTAPLVTILGEEISWRDIILIGGGLFLLTKATREIHHNIEEAGEETPKTQVFDTLLAVVAQIAVIDLIFSLDSVITAVGMVNDLRIMTAAIVIAVLIMLWASGPLSAFVSEHPTVKMLAMSFLLLVGMTLVADGLGQHIPKGYLYFAMGFSVLVEALNLTVSKRRKRAKEIS